MTSEAEAKLRAIRESQRAASKKQREKRKAMGYKLLGVEFSPEGLAALEAVKPVHGSMSAAVNAALIEAARRAEEPSRRQRGASEAEIANFVAMAKGLKTSKPSQGLKGDGAPPKKPKTPTKPAKGSSEAAARTAGLKLDVPFGPQPFTQRLKGKAK